MKSLVEMTRAELKTALSGASKNTIYSYNDVIKEMDRRRANLHALLGFVLGILAILVSVTSLLVSVLIAVFKK